ncbi:MAG TPA: flagellar basal body-associated FliL family protein [Vicinamibacterales bacterium]|jgi:flagellar FliL protein
MSDTPSNPAQAAAVSTIPASAKKSGAMKWIIIVVVAIFVLGGGGAAAWYFTRSGPPTDAAEGGDGEASTDTPPAEKALVGEGIVPLEQFLVNLADKGATRFVRLTLRLVVGTKKEAEEIGKDDVAKARLRSAIIEALAQETSERLVTPEGKTALKKTIAERCTPLLGGKKVLDVLFTDFVVQF